MVRSKPHTDKKQMANASLAQFNVVVHNGFPQLMAKCAMTYPVIPFSLRCQKTKFLTAEIYFPGFKLIYLPV